MILATRATGNAGGAVVRALLGAGERVRGLVPREANLPRLPAGVSSSAAPDGDLSNAIARRHIVSEHAVRGSGVAFTFIQPNAFMSNTLRWIPQLRTGNVVRAPFARLRTAVIDPDDVGAVAALALTSTGHEGRAYRLSGPESLLPADCVAVLADVLGRELRLEAQTDPDTRRSSGSTRTATWTSPGSWRRCAT
jgi:uncharacterized protein YbjT (DUF2867 family)